MSRERSSPSSSASRATSIEIHPFSTSHHNSNTSQPSTWCYCRRWADASLRESSTGLCQNGRPLHQPSFRQSRNAALSPAACQGKVETRDWSTQSDCELVVEICLACQNRQPDVHDYLGITRCCPCPDNFFEQPFSCRDCDDLVSVAIPGRPDEEGADLTSR